MNLGYLLFAAKMTCMKAMTAFDNLFIMLTVDIEELLQNEGAAADGGPLAPLNEQVISYGGGSYTITRNVAIYAVGISMLGGAAFMAVHAGNASKRDEDKSAFGWRVAAGVLTFGGISILLLAQKIGEALFR